MPTLKRSPNELSIHGGGAPSFISRLPVFSPNAGDGHRFGVLAERMFIENESEGRLLEEFEAAVSDWLGIRNVIGFSSTTAAFRCLSRALRINGRVYVPGFGHEAFPFDEGIHVECESATFGMSATALADDLRHDASGVFATHVCARSCMVDELDQVCDDAGVPLIFYGHQALGCEHAGQWLGGFGRAEVFELGRDQLIHGMDAAIVTTNDDLLAHQLRTARSAKFEGITQVMSDAAAAMAIANLESVYVFVDSNKERYGHYRNYLLDVPGIVLVRQSQTHQSITIEVNARDAGLTRDALFDVLTAENVGVAKLYDSRSLSPAPVAARLSDGLLQLPSGPAATEEAIQAVCRIVELAVIESLEAPDPAVRLAA
jgi:dTDP-4-amino-4,6-dideoxygalactose transaminase